MTKNQTSFDPGNQAAKKHGIYAFEARGPQTLAPEEVESLKELRALVKTEQGREELREEVTARLLVLVLKSFDEMAKKRGPELWNTPVLARAGTYLAELRRWLETFPPEDRDIIDLDATISKYRDAYGDNRAPDTERGDNGQSKD
jgi:hypothetical protein